MRENIQLSHLYLTATYFHCNIESEGGFMDPIHEKFLNRMKEFEQTHTKVDLPEHREKIKNLYEDFTLIFDEFSSTIEETEEDINITLTIGETETCRGGGDCLNFLIGLADSTMIRLEDNKIKFHLNYRLWKYIKK